MRTFDLVALMAFMALCTGFVILFVRYNGGGGGGGTYVIPSSRAPQGGGWLPGSTSTGYRNGGVGAASSEVWAN